MSLAPFAPFSHALKRIVILPDSLDAEDFRKLRVWLRWKEETQPV